MPLFSRGHIEDVRFAPLTLDEPVEFSVKERLDRKDIGWLESRLIYATLHMNVPFPKKNKYKYTLHWLDGNGKEVTSITMDITTLPFRYSCESN